VVRNYGQPPNGGVAFGTGQMLRWKPMTAGGGDFPAATGTPVNARYRRRHPGVMILIEIRAGLSIFGRVNKLLISVKCHDALLGMPARRRHHGQRTTYVN